MQNAGFGGEGGWGTLTTCKESKMALKVLYTGDQGHIGHRPLVVKEVESVQPG